MAVFKDGIWYDDDVPTDPETPPTEEPDTPTEPEVPEEPPVEEPPKPMTKSILLTIKKMLGISEEYHAFDIDVITNINSVFLNLNQLGVGPEMPYFITGDEQVWLDFLGDQEPFLAGVQTYIYLKVRLLFDPPTNSFLVDAMQKQIQELEWRLTVQPKTKPELNRQQTFKTDYSAYADKEAEEEEPPVEEPPNNEVQPLRAKAISPNKSITPMDIFS